MDDSFNDGVAGENDRIQNDVEQIVGGSAGDNLSAAGAPAGVTLDGRGGNDTLTGGAFADTLLGGAGADTFDGGGGVDVVSYADHSAAVIASLAGGHSGNATDGAGDTTANVENLVGTAAGDKLTGNSAINGIQGMGGNDTVQGGAGNDVLSGGAGVDTVDYSERASGQPVTVSLDGAVNDGATGEADNIGTDFEAINGGAGADTLSAAAVPGATLNGNSGNDTLFAPNGGGKLLGGIGDDKLTGGDGADVIDAGLGDDSIDGQGGKDTVSGGAGDDTIEARDGAADAIDCGADDDTALSDSVDTRKDCEKGSIKAPPVVVVVNDPTPQPQPHAQPVVTPRIFATLTFNFSAFSTFTKFTSFKVKNVPAGATVLVSCKASKGKKCVAKPFKKKHAGTISIKPYTKKKFPAGTKITVAITRPGAIGLAKVISVVKRKAPTSKTLCLPPGAKKPSKCTT
jgi:Ca2+-binding RTX toxin-like protein